MRVAVVIPALNEAGCIGDLVREVLLNGLWLREMTFGWPTEMIVKAARQTARIIEAPVSYQPRRGGTSKVGGTWQGSLRAGYKILSVTFGRD